MWLESRGPIGHVPGRPYAEPGRGRYGTFSFDRHELLARCEDLGVGRPITHAGEELSLLQAVTALASTAGLGLP